MSFMQPLNQADEEGRTINPKHHEKTSSQILLVSAPICLKTSVFEYVFLVQRCC